MVYASMNRIYSSRDIETATDKALKCFKGHESEAQGRPCADYQRIRSQLRRNRSIQAEGSFAETKEDMNFRRYLYRGKKNVLA